MKNRGFVHVRDFRVWKTGSSCWNRNPGRWRQDFRQLEVDDAEAAELVVVSDVAGFCIEVTNAVFALQVGEKPVGFFLGKLRCGLAAVRRYKIKLLGMLFQNFGT